nr:MAG TPA: hypothetical protein [Caudoviricetes sp.]
MIIDFWYLVNVYFYVLFAQKQAVLYNLFSCILCIYF